MTSAPNQFASRQAPPATYLDFLAEAQRFVESKGMSWEIERDQQGIPLEGQDWDLCRLTGSHAKNASRLGSFKVHDSVRSLALEAGWAPALLPQGVVLDTEVEAFLKAIAADRCRAAMEPRSTRHEARVLKTLFSSTSKMPWELTTEDIERFEALRPLGDTAKKGLRSLIRTVNEHLLSNACPLLISETMQKDFTWQASLDERAHAEKLPKLEALYELARIIFQVAPATHFDAIRFYALRVMVLTGLRLNEGIMLPADCLRWEDHVDVVTGKPADEVGGIARTLRLRYFALKQEEGRPDLLVEEHQWVPTRFQGAIAAAIEAAVEKTAVLRAVLAAQHSGAVAAGPNSDLRTFKTSAGADLTTADLLFLQVYQGRDVPVPAPSDLDVTVLNPVAMYSALGLQKVNQGASFFVRYGGGPDMHGLSVRPHSLRHLINTEMFRLGVPDTAITQQFGRTTVAQSYEYDHRSLAEKLSFISLPESASQIVVPGSAQELVAKMVVGGLVPKSHIARSFQSIQAEHGDLAAFRYLVANSDGFHVTPYGFCVNSFSMNPCARHLKCFDRCKHFTASGIPEHRVTLQALRASLVEMRAAAAAKPAKTVGRRNQISHAEALLAGVDATLAAEPNAPVFADGVDHSVAAKDVLS